MTAAAAQSAPKDSPRPISRTRYQLGECPRYDAARAQLMWVDILRGRLLHAGVHDLDRPSEHTVGRPLGAAAAAESGGWVLAAGRTFCRLTEQGTLQDLTGNLEPADLRMNDGACDPQGRFWAGTMAYDARPHAGRLHRLGSDGQVHTVLDGLTISNGLGWSPDGSTMYVTDSGQASIYTHRFNPTTGDLSDQRLFLRLRDGVPDGLAVDDDGYLWVAVWGGGKVIRVDPDGTVERSVPLPVSQPSSCCLIGTTLVITSAWNDLPVTEPDAGRLFAIDAPVAGPPATRYRGPTASTPPTAADVPGSAPVTTEPGDPALSVTSPPGRGVTGPPVPRPARSADYR